MQLRSQRGRLLKRQTHWYNKMGKDLQHIKNGLYLICNKNGQIVNVLFDDLELLTGRKLPVTFLEIIDKDNISKASKFWQEIQSQKFVVDYELLVAKDEGETIPLKFSAGRYNNRVWIIAAAREEDLEVMLEELMLMNNEQQNLIRRAEKRLRKLNKTTDPSSFDPYDEMSKVNNELINAQRELVKQNEKIVHLNRQLQESNRELEHFAYSVSHDLKEPLRMVRSFMKLLNERYSDGIDEKGKKYIHYAVDGADRMKLLIDDLLEFSRVGREKNSFEKTDLKRVLEDVVVLNRSYIDEHQGTVTWTEMPKIICQEVPMKQLFSNLITNSIKYRKEGIPPVVEIKCEEKSGKWLVSVSDNGKGIDPEYHKVVFDLFRRVDVSESSSGTGMGLAICKKIVEEHGGEIWVESKKGKGSTFSFTLEKQCSE